MGVTTTMERCKQSGHPVKVERPKGTPRPVILACVRCE